MKKRTLIALMCVGLGIAACSNPATTPIPSNNTQSAPTAAPATVLPTTAPTTAPLPAETLVATPTPTVAATPTWTPAPTLSPDQIAAYTRELSATVAALLPPLPTPDASGFVGPTFDGVDVWPLTTTNGAELWIAYSVGLRDFIGDHSHFIALYSHINGDWQPLLKFDLASADYVDPGSVRQIPLEPSHIWIEVESGAGAHGGCFDLYALDPAGRSQIDAATNCSDHPGAGQVRDLNGDGQLDVILDHTDSYVFCYACGLRTFNFSVMRWDGTQLIDQPLTPLPDSAPTDVRDLNKRAIDLAKVGLWLDAQSTIHQTLAHSGDDATVAWNAALINLHADAFKQQVDDQIYPLLGNVLYGDYKAALDVMRPYSPDQLFSLTGPLIKDTVAETWESTLADWITRTTNSAIQVQPDLAAAYFLRGYGEFLADQKNPAALADVEKAAALDPHEKLFSDSVEFLK